MNGVSTVRKRPGQAGDRGTEGGGVEPGTSESTDWTGSLDCGLNLRPPHLTFVVSVPSGLLSALEDASDEERRAEGTNVCRVVLILVPIQLGLR